MEMVYGLDNSNQKQHNQAHRGKRWLVWCVLANKNSRCARASS
jgi:hypothetical protein